MRRYSRSRRSGAREEAAEGISEGAVHPPPLPQADEGRSVDIILRGIAEIAELNGKARRATAAEFWMDGERIYVDIAGDDARYMSNALYHWLRAMGFNGVRRYRTGGGYIVTAYMR
jgi:tRNA threonylcarbamoyladenosine modification (KEOPS) complex  Pcc1 subunit